MPTPAELALQKKYAELRARKQQAPEAKTAPTYSPPPKMADGQIKVTLKSKQLQSSKLGKQAPVAAQQAPKVTLRSSASKQASKESKKTSAASQKLSPKGKASNAQLTPLDPQSAALQAAKKALAARQAANDKQAAAQSKTLKRPTFKRPAAKLPTPPAPIGDEVAQPSNKRPRLDVLLQQNTAQPHNASDGVRSSAAARDLAGDPQVWSPTQHTADPPYSPGDEGSAWSPTAAYQPQHHMQAGYSPGQEGYPPSQAPGPGGAVGYGHDQEQCYTYTGAGQAEAGLPGPSRLADRTMFVGNVPDDVTDVELAEYFCELGEVLSVQLRGNDGGHYGFVEFAFPESVQHVLCIAEQQPFMMGDHHLQVKPRRNTEQHQGSAPSIPGQVGSSEFEYAEPELPAARQARIQAEVKEAAAAAVDELDPEELQHLAPAPPPDRQLMVYDDI